MQGTSILLTALILTLLATLIPGLSAWRRAVTRNSGAAALPLLALGCTLLGSTQSADLSSTLPDPLRLVRAMAFSLLFVVSALGTAQRMHSIRLSGTGSRSMIAYAGLAIVSAIWSVAPLISIWKGFEVLTLVLALVATSARLQDSNDARWLLDVMGISLVFLCMTVIAGLILYPSLAIKDPDTTYTQYYFAVRGLVPVLNPASVGSVGALLLIIALAPLLNPSKNNSRSRLGLYFASGLSVVAMILAHARTPIFACTVAVILMLIYARKWKLIFFTAGVGSVLFLASSIEDLIRQYILRGQTEESFASLTGRIGFWERVWEQISLSPMIGHGYYAGQRLSFNTNSVDNTYLEVLIGLGLLGLVVFVIPLIWLALQLYRRRPRNGIRNEIDVLWLSAAGIFTILFIRSFTGASFQVMHPLLVIYMVTQIITAFLIRARMQPANEASTAAHDYGQTESTRILRKKKLQILNADIRDL